MDQSWSIKDLLDGQNVDFFLEEQTREIPSAILLARVANQKAGFVSSCPLTDSTIQLKRVQLLLSTIYQMFMTPR